MTRIFLSLFLFLVAPSFGYAKAETKSCWDSVVSSFVSKGTTPPLNECILEKDDGALEQLCGPNHNKPTEPFLAYLDYAEDYARALAAYQIAQSTPPFNYESERIELDSAENDWNAYGYRLELRIPLMIIEMYANGECAK